MTEFLVRAAKEVSDVLDDESQENREESVRCLGAYLHRVSARLNNVDDDREVSIKDLGMFILLRVCICILQEDYEQCYELLNKDYTLFYWDNIYFKY